MRGFGKTDIGGVDMGGYHRKIRRKKHFYAKTVLPVLLLLTGIISALYLRYCRSVHVSVPAAVLYELGDSSLTVEEASAKKASSLQKIGDIDNLSDLQRNYYAVDKKTGMDKSMFDIDKLLKTDVTINKSTAEPKILIFHTHPHEMFADSSDINEGVLGAGDYLAQLLEEKYGIKCLHVRDTSFDTVNGSLQRDGAYERMEPVITQIIAENPSIELVIDLHRDGVDESLHLAENVNGKPCAKIMFFNGLCMKWDGGVLRPTEGLSNPYIQTNLALSLKMQLELEKLYPGLGRRIYLNAYRYSLHMKDKSMLIELGAQTNTVEEIHNSIEILAQVLNNTVGK